MSTFLAVHPDLPAHERAVLATAARVAAALAPAASERDRERAIAAADLQALAASGLLAIDIPRECGGGGVRAAIVIEVIRLLAQADPAIAQTVQSHYSNTDRITRIGKPALRAALLARVVAGDRIGNASSERGGKSAGVNTTAVTQGADGDWIVQGVKHYATGALTAEWIAVRAVAADGRVATAFVAGSAAGIERHDDWRSLGQRATASGRIAFNAVKVPDALVQFFDGAAPAAQLNRSLTFLIHGAIEAGIAAAALADGVAFVQHRARPHPEILAEGGSVRVADDPYVQIRLGQLSARVHAAEALLLRASAIIDGAVDAEGVPDAEQVGLALIAMGEAKAYAADVALETGSEIFAMAGSSAADEALNLSRHWRNARTHSLHDSGPWKYLQSGRHLLHGVYPSWTPLRGEHDQQRGGPQ